MPELPTPPHGWLLFSEEYLLRFFQRRYGSGEPVVRSPGWVALAGLVRGVMAAVQALIMLLSVIPIINFGMEATATHFPRGGIGFFLRGAYWKTRLRHLGQDTLIDRGVEIWGGRNISIGARCHIDTYARLAAGEPRIGQKGHISIGDYTHIGPSSHIAGRGGVDIGRGVAVQAEVHIYSATNTFLHPRRPRHLVSFSHVSPLELQHIAEAPVRIGDYAMIGLACLLLPGAVIGEGGIVHPWTQVSKEFPPLANVVGPGRGRQRGWRQPPSITPPPT
ncbi:dTDP-4-amino-4,6-dideoxy-D-glucose acyltransferase [Phycisphaerae bacterium RAS1]|nr:dTDP-4-amino-4,6-dideoxy-D-glucose acyltransferase [Phycisphaerae bacterium RAS1]